MGNIGKNKRRLLIVYDSIHDVILSVDSQEEHDFVNWLCEAKNLSIINDFQYQPDSFQLSEAENYIDIDGKKRSLYREHLYSPDFLVSFNPRRCSELSKEFKISHDLLSCNEVSAFVDTKGTFNRNARSFSTDRKWLWLKFKVYICEVIPLKFFAKFGVPEGSRLSPKKKQPRSCFLGLKSLVLIFTSEK